MATDVSICTQALLLIGANEINSFSDQTREAKVSGELYPAIRDNELVKHPWSFSLGRVQLSQLVETPLYGFAHAYQLPPDRLIGRTIEFPAPYRIHEDKLLTDLTEVKMEYQFRPSESKFPAYFERLLVLRMAQDLAISLFRSVSKSEAFMKLADNQEATARYLDSQMVPNRAIRDDAFPLISVRVS